MKLVLSILSIIICAMSGCTSYAQKKMYLPREVKVITKDCDSCAGYTITYTYQYDRANRMIKRHEQSCDNYYNSTTTFTYDAQNRLIRSITTYPYDGVPDSISYQYRKDTVMKMPGDFRKPFVIYNFLVNAQNRPIGYFVSNIEGGLVEGNIPEKFDYDNSGNLIEEYYNVNYNAYCSNRKYTYDKEHHPFSNSSAINIDEFNTNVNNILTETFSECNKPETKEITTYTYEYNEAGFPTKQIKKEPDGHITITTYVYAE